MKTDHVIHGSCSRFVCRYCRTKFGWRHQAWCEISGRTEPLCQDCGYYYPPSEECRHPAIKQERRELPYEEDEHPL